MRASLLRDTAGGNLPLVVGMSGRSWLLPSNQKGKASSTEQEKGNPIVVLPVESLTKEYNQIEIPVVVNDSLSTDHPLSLLNSISYEARNSHPYSEGLHPLENPAGGHHSLGLLQILRESLNDAIAIFSSFVEVRFIIPFVDMLLQRRL